MGILGKMVFLTGMGFAISIGLTGKSGVIGDSPSLVSLFIPPAVGVEGLEREMAPYWGVDDDVGSLRFWPFWPFGPFWPLLLLYPLADGPRDNAEGPKPLKPIDDESEKTDNSDGEPPLLLVKAILEGVCGFLLLLLFFA